MDPNSGRLHYVKDAAEARSRGLVPVERDLTAKEQAELQIRLYSPCACGSGKKLKFCHYKRTTPTVPVAPEAK